MRLDHISYVTSHEQLSDTVQRLGAKLGTTFVDGGIHPRFGTRNFTAPLQNGHYIEVVCPLDHPATDSNAFGRAVSRRAQEGGGWLTWVLATDDIAPVETRIGRPAAEGHRMKPDGTDLRWKQIGVSDILHDKQLPFFIQWLSTEHPSKDGVATAAITKVEFAGDKERIREYAGSDLTDAIGEVEVIWVDPSTNDGDTGIVAVYLQTPHGEVRVD
jgi:hypothetical protein